MSPLGRAAPHAAWRPLLLAAAVAVVGALLLPLAPVVADRPVVTWPRERGRPTSTVLLLTRQTPQVLDLRVSCAAARRAAGREVFSTLRPELPEAAAAGLVVRADGGRVLLQTAGRTASLGPAAGDCNLVISADAEGVTVTRDGTELFNWPGTPVPQVDALVTAVPTGPRPADLSARLVLADPYASSPTPVKAALLGLVLAAAITVLGLLARQDRVLARRPRPRVRPSTADAVVVAVLAAWVPLAPTTDDDGYYAAMARNVGASGYVGNYFQMSDRSFAPFTWVWYALHGWQQLGGDSVVWLRLPALLAGLATWFALRRFAAPAAGTPRQARWLPAALAVAFAAWWLPYCMGVRPETVVALAAALVLTLVAAAVDGGRLLPAALAAAVAALALTAHPTGAVAVAPLLVALPGLWRVATGGATRAVAAARVGAVTAVGAAVVGVAGFADSSLHDVLLGRADFAAVEQQLGWADELQRYVFLLGDIPMGSYAKRTPVLVALALLAWFALLHVASRMAHVALPWRTSLAGWSLLLSFVLLGLTPSKWTHHFGAQAGLGPAFVALAVVTGPPAARALVARSGRPRLLSWLAAGSVAVAGALALRGPNAWPYWWNLGLPQPGLPPTVAGVRVGSLAVALAVLGLVAVAVRVAVRGRPWRSQWTVALPPVLAVLVLAGVAVYLLGSFGLAAARTTGTWSPGAAALTDPGGCSASDAVDVFDEHSGVPLPVAVPAPDPTPDQPFRPAGYWPGSPPPAAGHPRQAWGSLTARGEQAVGTYATPWFALPQPWPGGARVVSFVAGHAAAPSRLTVELGTRRGNVVVPLTRRPVVDPESATSWRGQLLAGPADQAAGADVLRLVARDGETGLGGWLAVTAPELQRPVPLARYLPTDATALASWQLALLFPCLRYPVAADGVVEPPRYALTWAQPPFATLADEATWQVGRAGLGAGARRVAVLVSPASVLRADPEVPWGRVYRFSYPYPTGGYRLDVERETVPGWRAAGPGSQPRR